MRHDDLRRDDVQRDDVQRDDLDRDVRHDDPRDLDGDGVRDDLHDGPRDDVRQDDLRDDVRREPDVPEQGVPAGATPPFGSPFGTPGPATTEPATDPVTDADGRHHEPGVEDPDRRETGIVAPDPDPEPELLAEPEPVDEPAAETTPVAAAPAPTPAGDDAGAALFGTEDVARFRLRWRELQADFVDDPKDAVRGADELVGELMTALSEIVAEHKRTLEEGWHNGPGETEDLRVALRRYRSFFDQLLKT